jgi:hypothetical protein
VRSIAEGHFNKLIVNESASSTIEDWRLNWFGKIIAITKCSSFKLVAQISSSSFVALEASKAGLGMEKLGRAGLASQLASFGCVANFGTGRA